MDGLSWPLLAGLVGVSVIYMVWWKRGGGSHKLGRWFGFAPGDGLEHMWVAEYAVEVSALEKVGVAAAGLMFGVLATVRPRRVHIGISRRKDLAIVVELDDDKRERLIFSPGSGLTFAVLGPSPRRIQGGDGVAMRFSTPDGRSLDLYCHHSAPIFLERWAAGAN